PAVEDPEYVIQSVSPGANSITFTQPHGLTTGTTLRYLTDGAAVNGLVNNQEYGILVVNDTTIMVGSQFDGAWADPDTNTIHFGQSITWEDGTVEYLPLYHGFTTDTMVVYYDNGGSVPGLVNG